MATVTSKSTRRAVQHCITLRGTVQGRGIRPAVARIANELRLFGTVHNVMDGVDIQVQCDGSSLRRFVRKLTEAIPDGTEINVEPAQTASAHHDGFHIQASNDHGSPRTIVPTDRVVCDACRQDVRTHANRRYDYPFTSCTDCGPRYTILNAMPFDRHRTSMSAFEMCEACRAEYENPSDRRFHSQTNCCWICGPRLWSTTSEPASTDRVEGRDALGVTIESLRRGEIVAVKGIGGYQLVCDATSERSTRALRERKHRPTKPLAVMVADLEDAAAIAKLSSVEIETLRCAAGPIVVARAQRTTIGKCASAVCGAVHPGLRDIGVMLPTSPLHMSLLDGVGAALVVTSGNVDGEPLVYRTEDAERQLSEVADRFLHHDREIVRPIDDSVVRCIGGRTVSLRAARGMTPLPLVMPSQTPAIATGGQQKATVALSNGYQSILGPHLGDLNSLAGRERYREQLDALCRLYKCEPELTAHDSHPDYFTSQLHLTSQRKSIQHHHAHVVSGMLQHGWLDQTVLGIAFDGTGFGCDGTIWGGEILLASNENFDRVGHLRPIGLAGAEAAIGDPLRIAIALILDAVPEDFDDWVAELGFDPRYARTIAALLRNHGLSPRASSVGRLFDGVAALTLDDCGGGFEGEPAMRLEAACDGADAESYPIEISNHTSAQIDWRPMVAHLLRDKQRGVTAAVMATRFHRGLAQAVAQIIARYPKMPVVLSGGAFQNQFLVERILESTPADRKIGLPGEIPPNDGGLAAGQLACAANSGKPVGRSPCV